MARFRDRLDAGRQLADKLGDYAGRRSLLVLGLPRGGVPVAFEVARALGAPLDVFLVRKLGVPGHRELAMGAIATGGVRVLNLDVIREMFPELLTEGAKNTMLFTIFSFLGGALDTARLDHDDDALLTHARRAGAVFGRATRTRPRPALRHQRSPVPGRPAPTPPGCSPGSDPAQGADQHWGELPHRPVAVVAREGLVQAAQVEPDGGRAHLRCFGQDSGGDRAGLSKRTGGSLIARPTQESPAVGETSRVSENYASKSEEG